MVLKVGFVRKMPCFEFEPLQGNCNLNQPNLHGPTWCQPSMACVHRAHASRGKLRSLQQGSLSMRLGASLQQTLVGIQAIGTSASQHDTSSGPCIPAAFFTPFAAESSGSPDTPAVVQVLLPGGKQLLTGTSKGQLQMWPVRQDSSGGAECGQVRSATSRLHGPGCSGPSSRCCVLEQGISKGLGWWGERMAWKAAVLPAQQGKRGGSGRLAAGAACQGWACCRFRLWSALQHMGPRRGVSWCSSPCQPCHDARHAGQPVQGSSLLPPAPQGSGSKPYTLQPRAVAGPASRCAPATC